MWSGCHQQSRHILTLRQKVDRALLLVLYEQSRQILMVRIDKFGPIADQHRQLPVGDPVLASALDMMKEIADRYAKGSIERQGLSDARGQMLRAMGLEMRKRPAACDEEPKMAPMKRATTDDVKSTRAEAPCS